ncbi:hypothetical protein A3Q56_04905 [Intoshia linei]|uniref:XK-related protein n=1 Tax=Intoshia linei TaxID=1819745 RepID=A0A177AZH8_9BILA|nr:hypothetical protein A3Q56_04905 [Intoshia linei]
MNTENTNNSEMNNAEDGEIYDIEYNKKNYKQRVTKSESYSIKFNTIVFFVSTLLMIMSIAATVASLSEIYIRNETNVFYSMLFTILLSNMLISIIYIIRQRIKNEYSAIKVSLFFLMNFPMLIGYMIHRICHLLNKFDHCCLNQKSNSKKDIGFVRVQTAYVYLQCCPMLIFILLSISYIYFHQIEKNVDHNAVLFNKRLFIYFLIVFVCLLFSIIVSEYLNKFETEQVDADCLVQPDEGENYNLSVKFYFFVYVVAKLLLLVSRIFALFLFSLFYTYKVFIIVAIQFGVSTCYLVLCKNKAYKKKNVYHKIFIHSAYSIFLIPVSTKDVLQACYYIVDAIINHVLILSPYMFEIYVPEGIYFHLHFFIYLIFSIIISISTIGALILLLIYFFFLHPKSKQIRLRTMTRTEGNTTRH